jgi:hypothetical protein
MLYLIKNHQGYLKIGSTSDLKNRLGTYKSHGAEIILIDTCEGTLRLEMRLQTILYHKGLRVFSEWFEDNPIVYKIWEMAKNKKWKPIYYMDAVNINSKNNEGNTPFDIYLYSAVEVRNNYEFKYKCVEPKIYRKHLLHFKHLR